jgi:PAS domain S-box-containing protein
VRKVGPMSTDAALVEAAWGAPAAFYQFRLSPSGTYGLPFVSPEFAARYGFEQGEPEETAARFFSRIHPDDLEAMREAIPRSARTLETFECEFRFRLPTGAEVWVDVRSNPKRTADGGVLWNGILTDITARRKAEVALRESEERFRALAETSFDWVWEVDPEGRYTYVSPRAADLLGYAAEEILGKTPFDLMPEDEAHRVSEIFGAIAAERKPFTGLVNVNLHKSGRRVVLETSGIPVFGPGGDFRGYCGTDRDITERAAAEAALCASEEQFRAIFEGSRDAVFLTDEEGRFVAVNHAATELTGFSREELLAMRIPDLHDTLDLAAYRAFHRRILDGERVLTEAPVRRKDGRKVAVEFNNSVVVIGGRRLMHTAGRDVSERKEAAEALAVSEARYRALFENAAEGIVAIDPATGRHLFFNPAICAMFGYTPEEFGELATDRLHPAEALDAIRHDIGLTAQGKRAESDFVPCVRKDGSTFQADIHGSVFELEGRKVVLGFFTDMTERMRATRRLTLQAAMGRVLAESASLAEAVPRILQALGENEGMIFGAWWEPDPDTGELRCAHTWSADPARCVELDAATRSLAMKPGAGIPWIVWTTRRAFHGPALEEGKNHPRAPVAARAGLRSAVGFPLLRDGAPVGVVEFFAPDIPVLDPALAASVELLGGQIALYVERRRAQEESARYIAGNPAVIYAMRLMGANLNLTWFSDNVFVLTGYSRAEIENDAQAWWVEGIHPDDRARVFEASRSAFEKDESSIEFRFRRKDGTWLWVRDERRLLRDAAGRPAEIVGSWMDVTARVRLEERLLQSQRMEAVGQLAGGVAHDFNNLLTVISGNCDLLLSDTSADDPTRGPLTDIRIAGERAANLTRQLLAFSRRQILEPRLVDVHEVVTGIEQMLRRLLGEDVEVLTNLAADESWVKVDPGQLEQVVMNLAVNARDAMPRGGRITIGTQNIPSSDSFDLEETAGRQLRPKVAISISDTGSGIAPEVKARIFEPFFTTKGVGKGTGLGLATVFGIVKQSGGEVTVESEPGEGATFTVTLPSQPAPRQRGAGASLHAAPRGTETVLAVEDEDAVRRIVKIALESAGYRVIEARSGSEALEVVRRHAGAIHLVVTDVVMPEMSGRELAERIVKDHPGVRILYMSGYTDDAVMRHGIVESGVAFLQKPFSPLALARKVREVLDEKAPYN